MISGDIIKRLGALRLDPDQMAEVLSIIGDIQSADDARRQKQRERTAKSRAKNVTVTLQERHTGDTVTVTPHPDKENPQTPKEINPSPNSSSLRSDAGGAVIGVILPPESTASPVSRLWAEAIPILATMGISEGKARPIVGKWVGQAGNDHLAVLGAIQRARDNAIVDPIPWITRALAKPSSSSRLSRHETPSDRMRAAFTEVDGLFASRRDHETVDAGPVNRSAIAR